MNDGADHARGRADSGDPGYHVSGAQHASGHHGPGSVTRSENGGKAPQGILMHSVVAVNEQGVPLGLLHQQVWVRPLEEVAPADLSKVVNGVNVRRFLS